MSLRSVHTLGWWERPADFPQGERVGSGKGFLRILCKETLQAISQGKAGANVQQQEWADKILAAENPAQSPATRTWQPKQRSLSSRRVFNSGAADRWTI